MSDVSNVPCWIETTGASRVPAPVARRRLERSTEWWCYTVGRMDPDELTPEQHAWLEHDAELWERARAIAARHPGMDIGDVRHTLYNLEKTPEERLARSLSHGANRRLYAR